MKTKAERQRALSDLIRSQPTSSQEDLVRSLASRGFNASQGTISRDLEQLGAVRTREGGGMRYRLPEELALQVTPGQLPGVLADWVRSIAVAGNLVILKTPPGSAHLVGAALDAAGLDDAVGTLAGDDTIFVAAPDARAASGLAARLESIRR